MPFLTTSLVLFAFAVSAVRGESHTVTFVNKCGKGMPRLIQGSSTLSTGAAHTVNGPLIGAIAYLQTGSCGFNGESCTMVETTLKNPTTPGSGSSTDITLIAPHKFSVTTGFKYTNGCSTGADCTSASCKTAFHVSTDTQVQVACQANNVNLEITFCD
ncbi:glycopeptide [Roridomyces roridus]|uniref:Glycopeptide n=1 Tax=Roridomyces roridus TaxID=1738132 RepID=A0AAD7AZG9_9AGAR|nr:glycopeptide [Roridomyces roridus]